MGVSQRGSVGKLKKSGPINRYVFPEECLRGEYREEKQNYDLMSVVVLRLGRKGEDSGDESKLFSRELGYEKKLGALRNVSPSPRGLLVRIPLES